MYSTHNRCGEFGGLGGFFSIRASNPWRVCVHSWVAVLGMLGSIDTSVAVLIARALAFGYLNSVDA